MVIQTRRYTVAEFEQFISLPENQDRYFELIDGEIVEKMPTEEHGVIIFRLSGELYIYFRQNPIGRGTVEVRYQKPGDDSNALQPDLSVTLHPESAPVKSGVVMRMPDIAVEVKSPSNTNIGLRNKAAYYIKQGSRMVWLIYPAKQLVEVYRPDRDLEILTMNDVLDGADVLPGFSLPVKDIFQVE